MPEARSSSSRTSSSPGRRARARLGSTCLPGAIRSSRWPQPMVPEPKFFLVDELWQRGVDYYSKQWFDLLPAGRMLGEKSTNYLEAPEVAERISRVLPRVKLIFLLRNPVDRAYSNYLWSRQNGLETETFEPSARTRRATRAGSGATIALRASPRLFFKGALRRAPCQIFRPLPAPSDAGIAARGCGLAAGQGRRGFPSVSRGNRTPQDGARPRAHQCRRNRPARAFVSVSAALARGAVQCRQRQSRYPSWSRFRAVVRGLTGGPPPARRIRSTGSVSGHPAVRRKSSMRSGPGPTIGTRRKRALFPNTCRAAAVSPGNTGWINSSKAITAPEAK